MKYLENALFACLKAFSIVSRSSYDFSGNLYELVRSSRSHFPTAFVLIKCPIPSGSLRNNFNGCNGPAYRQNSLSAFTSEYRKLASYGRLISPNLTARTGAGPQRYQPSDFSCGVASTACQPPYVLLLKAKSGRSIHSSFHTW